MANASRERDWQDSPTKKWTVALNGSFRLTTPDGRIARLQNSKVEALLAILVRNREYGISRDDLVSILWPNKAHDLQRSSLRQALSLCRKVLGSDVIETTQGNCRIPDDFPLELTPASGIFMPGHDGEFFDSVRCETLIDIPSEPGEQSVLRAWLQVLDWNSTHDPGMFFKMLRIAPHQAEGLPFAELERLLAQASSLKKDGWTEYWWGTVLPDLEECRIHLKTALNVALHQQDGELISKICLELGRAYSRTGRLTKALMVSNLADDMAARSGSTEQIVNALRLKATLNFHWGDADCGCSLFQQAIQLAPTTMEQYQLTASLALFQAGYGFEKDAQRNLDLVRKYSEALGHMKLSSLARLTQLILTARSSEPNEGYISIQRATDDESSFASEQLVNYTQELLYSLCTRSRETHLANLHQARALQARKITRDVTTNWVRILRGDLVEGRVLV